MCKQWVFLFFSLALWCLPVGATAADAAVANAADKGTAPAQDAPQPSFYEDRRHGFYWYEQAPTETEEKTEPPGKATPPAPPADLAPMSVERLWKLRPEAFKERLRRVTRQALHEPNEENVTEYLKMVDVSRRKSLAFASAAALYSQKNPQYSIRDSSPITSPGLRADTNMQQDEINRTLWGARKDFGLVVFVQSGCGFCDAQMGILEYFNREFEWEIQQVDIHAEPALAARFGVETTPTMLVVQGSTGRFMPVSAGVVSVKELKDNLYRSIRYLTGQVGPEQYLIYDYQRGKGADPLGTLKGKQK